MNDELVHNMITFQTTLYVDVWDDPADKGCNDVHLIDQFTIAIPETLSSCDDQSKSLTVHGLHGVGNLTLTYFNLSTAPITSCSSEDVPTSKIHVITKYPVPHLTVAHFTYITNSNCFSLFNTLLQHWQYRIMSSYYGFQLFMPWGNSECCCCDYNHILCHCGVPTIV